MFVTYRELAGLGPVSGMNDAYAWGIWKTFNTMTLTGLGSGAFAIGVAAWLFKRKDLHVVMRTACLTSFLAYLSGLALLGVDVGRPWNFYWVFTPWRWNLHSPLLEVAVCMPTYAMIPLLLENFPPFTDWLYSQKPQYRPYVKKAEEVMIRFYPFIVGLGVLAACDAPVLSGGSDAAGRQSSVSVVANAMAACALRVGCGVPGVLVRGGHVAVLLDDVEASDGSSMFWSN